MKKLLLLFILIALSAFAEIRIIETPNALSAAWNGKTLWTYNHDPAEGKPYFHPLASTDGTLFTGLRPDDHPWHRGVWFSWKFINGVNYWEEDRTTGKSAGETRLINVKRKIKGRSVQITLELEYAPTGSDTPVMRENRQLTISPPGESGSYRIDWTSTFRAMENDVILDRTPLPDQPDGKSWGGYAGWSVRMNTGMKEGVFRNSEGDRDAHRKAASWMLFSSPDGGSLLFMDHPDNFSYPSRWYVAPNMPFFSPSVIHDGPHTIGAGASLKLKYRLVVFPDTETREEASLYWKDWAAGLE